jgi:hypothetical protein
MDCIAATAFLRRCISHAQRHRRLALVLPAFVVAVVGVTIALPHSAGIVVLNRPKPADVIIVAVTDPYYDDLYYQRAVQLLARNYGKYVLLPADATGDPSEATEARAFIDRTAGAQRPRVLVCPEGTDEFQSLGKCLDRLHARTVLMVAPAPVSRSSLMLYKDRLPGYSWSIAAVSDPAAFGNRWWSNRQWAKAYVEGLQRLVSTAIRQ